jgi:hypothetical protein
MFWKKKSPPQEQRIDELRLQRPKAVSRKEAAERLAASLREYSDVLAREMRTQRDQEVLDSQAKIDAAMKIVSEGRLAYALGRAIPEAIKSWPRWIERDDFDTYVSFDAQDIQAVAYTEKDQISRDIEVVDVAITFNGNPYRFVLRDRFFPGYPHADIELWDQDTLVAHFYLGHSDDEFPHFKFETINAFRVGPWMKDVLTMAAQIEAFNEQRRQTFHDDQVRQIGRNIELG